LFQLFFHLGREFQEERQDRLAAVPFRCRANPELSICVDGTQRA
jgi:hypothetical protein